MQLDTIALPDNVQWADYWQWDPVREAASRAGAGSLVIEQSTVQGGRPITLTGMWVTRDTAAQLQALAAQTGQTHTLTLPGGEQYTVLFRRGGDGPPVEVADLWADAPDVYEPTDQCTLTLRLREAASAYIG